MPLNPLPFREIKRRLEAAGFREYRQKGSHVKFIKEVNAITLTVIVPHHQQVAVGTLRSILRQAGITVQEWGTL